MISTKKVIVAKADAGRFADNCSEATLACADMVLTIHGQTLRTSSTAATRNSAGALWKTQSMQATVASVAVRTWSHRVRM